MGNVKPPAVRIVHLLGGFRAVDLGTDTVQLEISSSYRFGHLPTPEYPELYSSLLSIGFEPIGVEFFTNNSLSAVSPPDWQAILPGNGFVALGAERAWRRIRHSANRSQDSIASGLAARISTYLKLTSIRLYQLSSAYNSCLNMAVQKPSLVPIGHGFGNQWSSHVDAAIHGFLSDAGCFRDVLAEAVWHLVVSGRSDSVHTLTSLLKETKHNAHPLVQKIAQDAKPRGWLHQLMELRNNVIHVAPIADSQEHHFAQMRGRVVSDFSVPFPHFPLLTEHGDVRRVSRIFVDYKDEKSVVRSLESYNDYLGSSQDALTVCRRLYGSLVELSESIRKEARLSEEEVTITDADLVGPVVTH